MKKGIHPKYQTTSVTCVNCGEQFEVGSTASEIRVEVCSKCHPFYTGQETYTQAAGRVERFKKRYGIGEAKSESKKATKATVKEEKPEVEVEPENDSKDDLKDTETK